MSFEELDKKIRDASDMHQPSYNEKAWTKMEQLLDKHLPQEKKYKKRIFFWVLTLFISTSLLTIWLNRDLGDNVVETSASKENLQKPIPQDLQPGTVPNKNDINNSDIQAGAAITGIQDKLNTTDNGTVTNSNPPNSTLDFNKNAFHSLHHPFQSSTVQSATNNLLPGENNWKSLYKIPVESIHSNSLPDNNILAKYYNNDLRARIPSVIPPINYTNNLKSIKRSFAQNLSFAVSAGPSVSSVNMDNPGKLTALYGGSIKYAFNNKWTVGAGFFINKKIYTAGKDDYKPPAGYWTYYTDLLSVDADCDVYEIPLNISYSIKKTGKHEWLASTGISSYFMKKETYNYLYKNQSGQVLNREWSIEKKNIHHLSTLNLSAGYRHHINNRISVVMEPNIKIPLKGVGYGKVKFYDAGTLITLQIKPFAKK